MSWFTLRCETGPPAHHDFVREPATAKKLIKCSPKVHVNINIAVYVDTRN